MKIDMIKAIRFIQGLNDSDIDKIRRNVVARQKLTRMLQQVKRELPGFIDNLETVRRFEEAGIHINIEEVLR